MNRPGAMAVLAILAASVAFGQDAAGVWEGTVSRPINSISTTVSRPERTIVNISRDKNGHLTGMMYGTDQAGPTFPFLSITYLESNLTFVVNRDGVFTFNGRMSADGNSIDGWYGSQPLHLRRSQPLQAKANPSSWPAIDSVSEATRLLGQAQEKIGVMRRNLTKYTCLESVDRTIYAPRADKMSRKMMTEAPPACHGIRPGHAKDLVRESSDRLRLQVAVAANAEIQSWPNEPVFGAKSLFQMVRTGPISTGSFGLYLVDVFLNPGTIFHLVGREKKPDGATVFIYNFNVPLKSSHMEVRGGDRWIVTAYAGSFEINTATAELASLRFETDELPPATAMCRSATSIDYHMVLIGDGELLLPIRSELDHVRANHEEGVAVTTFSGCHEYLAESSIHFDDGTSPDAKSEQAAHSPIVLPPGLPITLALIGTIDHNAAAGDQVEARVRHEVRDPESNRVLIPAGAIARGRLTLMRHQFAPTPAFQVSMSFNQIEVNGAFSPLSLRVARSHEKPRRENGLLPKREEFSLPADDGESEVTIAFGDGRSSIYGIPSGWESKWITR